MNSHAFLRALVASSSDPIIGKTTDGTIVLWNEAATKIYGYERSEALGRNVAMLVPPQRMGELEAIFQAIQQGESIRQLRTKRMRKDGSTVAVALTISPVFNLDGAVIGASTLTHDLTHYLLQVEDLREARRRADEAISTLETMQASAPVGLGFVDGQFRFVHVNEMFASFSNSSIEDLVGRTVREVVPEIWSQVEPIYRRVLEFDKPVLNIEVVGDYPADPGRRRFWLANYYPVDLLDEPIGVGIVLVDITERRHAEEIQSIAMKQLAEGLYTVDAEGHLSSMNDAASRLLGWTEQELIGKRMHEFVLLGTEGGPSNWEGDQQLLRVRREGVSVRLENHAYRCKNGSALPVAISASPLIIGGIVDGAVVVFRDITSERSETLRIQRELDSLSWVGRIREALDEGRLVLYSQPIVPLTGGSESEELLLRMVGRDGDIIPPGAFLGAAEKYGLIAEIDRMVIARAIRRAAVGVHVSVNLSAESIMSMDVVSLISQELADSDVIASNVTVEITETSLMRDVARGEQFARGIVELGCKLALDDFGTGYGTFTHVKHLPVSVLKIDIEFVRDLVTYTANQHVVKAVVNLAQGFGCQTVAEGVEDAETLEMLREFGVDFAQGYFLGRPMPM